MKKLKTDELNRLSIETFKVTKKIPLVIVLDNIRSLHNVGSAFRTADAFLAEKIYLCGITGVPPHREIQKTALGATESVTWEYVSDIKKLMYKLKNEGFIMAVVEQTDEKIFLQDFMPDKNKKYCFIFGNEVFGVSDEVFDFVNFCLEIPQFGTKHSLNISVCMGIVVWDFFKKLNS